MGGGPHALLQSPIRSSNSPHQKNTKLDTDTTSPTAGAPPPIPPSPLAGVDQPSPHTRRCDRLPGSRSGALRLWGSRHRTPPIKKIQKLGTDGTSPPRCSPRFPPPLLQASIGRRPTHADAIADQVIKLPPSKKYKDRHGHNLPCRRCSPPDSPLPTHGRQSAVAPHAPL